MNIRNQIGMAYSLRGAGSTNIRKMRIESIFERWLPIPNSRGDRLVLEFLNEVKDVVNEAVAEVEKEVVLTNDTAGG